jgi:glutaconate CoA-transferase subunit A
LEINQSEILKQKIYSTKEAVSQFIQDGDSIAMGTALEAAIPFAIGHEIIRQGKKDLTLIGPISDMLFDQLLGSGCVQKVIAAWVGNVIMGVGYNMRRAVEKGIPRKIEIEDYTNFALALALHAGALGIPYIPTKTLLGTGMMSGRHPFKEMECPFTKEKLALVPAMKPDVSIVQAQRADEDGNTHFWGGERCDEGGGVSCPKSHCGGRRNREPKSDPKRSKSDTHPWLFSPCGGRRTLGSASLTHTWVL